MDKTADSTNRASGPQLKREQAAMLSHYELMHGLALISNLRLRKYLGLIEAQRAKKTVEEDPLDTLRKAMRQEASIKPKARMLWDENREIDLYTWGPLQLFFCVAWAFLDKYRYEVTSPPPEGGGFDLRLKSPKDLASDAGDSLDRLSHSARRPLP